MPLMNFRVDEETKAWITAEATKVPYRTISDYLREIVVAARKQANKAAKKEKA